MNTSETISILFDFDGTLVDTMKVIEMVVKNGMERLGSKLDEKKMMELITSLELDDNKVLKNTPKGGKLIYFKLFHYLGKFLGLSRLKSFIFMLYCLVNVPKNYKYAKPFEGVSDMILGLQSESISLGIVTSARKKDIEKLFKRHLSNFNVIVTREMVSKIKPSPEGILKAMEMLNSNPKKTVYIGDFPHDIMAAREAGINSIAVLTGSVTDAILEKENPTKICSNAVEAVEWYLKSENIYD